MLVAELQGGNSLFLARFGLLTFGQVFVHFGSFREVGLLLFASDPVSPKPFGYAQAQRNRPMILRSCAVF